MQSAFDLPDSSLCYPCRCLCFFRRGQITYTRPRRRMMRQCSHIFLTDVRTFMGKILACSRRGGLFIPVRDAAAMQVVGRQLHRYPVAGQNLDKVHSHLARNMRENLVTVFEHDTERRIGKTLLNDSVYLNRRFFGRTASSTLDQKYYVRISGLPAVTSTVCSKCAEGLRSRVSTCQSPTISTS